MGPAVFLDAPPPPLHSWSLLECAAPWPLLAVWDPRFSWAHRQPPLRQTHKNCTTKGLRTTQLPQESTHVQNKTQCITHVWRSHLPRQAPTHTNSFPCASLVTPFILNSKSSTCRVAIHVFIFLCQFTGSFICTQFSQSWSELDPKLSFQNSTVSMFSTLTKLIVSQTAFQSLFFTHLTVMADFGQTDFGPIWGQISVLYVLTDSGQFGF